MQTYLWECSMLFCKVTKWLIYCLLSILCLWGFVTNLEAAVWLQIHSPWLGYLAFQLALQLEKFHPLCSMGPKEEGRIVLYLVNHPPSHIHTFFWEKGWWYHLNQAWTLAAHDSTSDLMKLGTNECKFLWIIRLPHCKSWIPLVLKGLGGPPSEHFKKIKALVS